ncbi:TonB-dependent receptor [Sulfurimonas sp. CS5]|uniref:TonB-dependent receptor n=1 Tax=Sulfurimonas sp. CS5 TaxID=3391145 RepID=UPI0039E95110
MKKRVYLSVICALVINATASDLGTIQVESSTIDDKFANKLTEVSSTSTMQGSEVEEFHAENIADVLNTLPGVTVRKNEGDSNKIHIRGVGTEMYMGEKPGVAIVIDGVPVQERAGSVNIDIDNIQSIKVLKGGASYLYGNDALAGAIIITTKRPKNKNKGLATIEQGSYGYGKYLAAYNAASENFAANVQASYKRSNGYWDDSDYWTKSANGKFQYYINDSSDITFGADKTLRYENDTGSITHTTYDAGVYTNQVDDNPKSAGEVGYATKYDIDLEKYFVTYSNDITNNSNLMTQLYTYKDTTTNRSSAYDSNNDGLNDDHVYDSYAKTNQIGLKSEYRLSAKKFALMAGLDIAKNEEDKSNTYRVDYTSRGVTTPAGTVSSDTNSMEDINAIYGELKYKVSKDFVTTLNARYDQISYDYTNNLTSANWKKTYYEDSYRVGATYNLKNKQILFTSISTGFRVPTVSQLYAGDILSGRYTYANNTNISTEKTINYEIGIRQKTDLLSYEISIFQLNRNDVIAKDSGNYVTDPTAAATTYGNYADIRNRGLELAVNSNKKKDLSFVFSYTYLDSKYTRFDNYKLILNGAVDSVHDLAGNTVPRTSNHTVYLEGNYRVMPSVLLTADVNYKSSQYADDLNRVEVDGYAVVNLRAKYNTKVSDFDIEVFGKIENLFDNQYYMMPRVTGDRNNDGLYDIRDMGLTVNPGRTLLAGATIKF